MRTRHEFLSEGSAKLALLSALHLLDMASASKAVASASQALSKAAAPSIRPRRVSKRTQQTSRTSSLSNLISLYHLTPTFVPTATPSQLQQHVTDTLAPLSSATAKPRPKDLLDLVLAQHKLDQERIKLDTAATSPSSASLLGVRLRQTANSDSFDFSATGGGGVDGAIYDHQHSFYSSHTAGSEPPLAKRVRRVVDKLHGTEAGGRAGVQVLEEQGEKAVQWKEGLRDARRQEKEREEREDQEAEGFGQAFAA